MNSKRKNWLVVLVGFLAYIFFTGNPDWFIVGGIGAIAAGACLGNLILFQFPLTGKQTDWQYPLLAAIIPTLLIVLVRSQILVMPAVLFFPLLSALLIITFGLISIPYRIARSKLKF